MEKKKPGPTPVKIIETEKAIPVIVEEGNKMVDRLIDKDPERILSPNTTEEEDRVALGQRNINLIWERTQSRIALISVISSQTVNAVVIAAMLIRDGVPDPARIAVVTASVAAMNLTVGIIIGFYFSRTNHSAIGGTGKKTLSSNAGTR
ncbi:MAG: hypothetical protein ACSLE0_01050 [Chitinophagaceae bacterium]